MHWLLALVVSFSAFAQTDMDSRLDGYVKEFGLKPLRDIPNESKELRKLGHMLFTERLLSGNKNISCMECHSPAINTHDGLPLSLGEGAIGIQGTNSPRTQRTGHMLPRNSPALLNLGTQDVMFWDGRVSFDPTTKILTTPEVALRADIRATLTNAVAAQALFPMVDAKEMKGAPGTNEIADAKDNHEAWDLLVARLMKETRYQEAFAAAFPNQKINIGHVGEAMAAFFRTQFHFNDTPYDRYLKGDRTALSEIQKKGMDIFFDKGKCGSCHIGENLANGKFANVGTPQIGPGKSNGDDLGRGEFASGDDTQWAFKVPALRNVSVTAPYMHNGAYKTIAQIIEHYDDVEASLSDFQLVNNFTNYSQIIQDHDHSKDAERIASLSKDLTPKLNFLEEEEKALAEFLNGALTDYFFLNRELSVPYTTYYRLSLLKSGYEKLKTHFVNREHRMSNDTWYYFDIFREGGYFLRELEKPMRLYLSKNNSKATMFWREVLLKRAASSEGVVIEGNFVDERRTDIPLNAFTALETAYQDMFNRLYKYHNDQRQDEIPVVELGIIKQDLEVINDELHAYNFEGETEVTDRLNIPSANLFYVPTSFNYKQSLLSSIEIEGKTVELDLQASKLRDEFGGHHETFALELRTGKITKAQYEAFSKKLLENLAESGLTPDDIGGFNPSPSRLTVDVIGQIYPNE